MFINDAALSSGTWQWFERVVARLLMHEGYEGIRLVGRTGDGGADLIAHRAGKRWLFQIKKWQRKVGLEVVDQTIAAMRLYRAQIPVIVSLKGFEEVVLSQRRELAGHGIPLQLWDRKTLLERAERAPIRAPVIPVPRDYQEEAIRLVVRTLREGFTNQALVVMATGLGKTLVAAEAVRRLQSHRPLRVLALAHTNELVYQLERSFWPFITKQQETLVWNSYERQETESLGRATLTYACVDSVYEYLRRGGEVPPVDLILVDECHHAGSMMYQHVLKETRAGQPGGPFLLGLTATPWRPDETDLSAIFGEPLVCIDMIAGLRMGFLANVDYRIFTDNIRWEALGELHGNWFSPRHINRTLFIHEWDDAVVLALKQAWTEQPNPRAIVFCGTVDHAIFLKNRINAMGFCAAEAIFSQTWAGARLDPVERSRILSDFHDGQIQVICAVDIFNEGIDVPDVNIVVFQRVTHSRRIFVQQLGRGLRLAPHKDKVIVLDFVSDIRRFAAGIELKDGLSETEIPPWKQQRVKLHHRVTFQRVGGADPQAETFLRQWLEDIATIEGSGDDASVLRYPPLLPGGRT